MAVGRTQAQPVESGSQQVDPGAPTARESPIPDLAPQPTESQWLRRNCPPMPLPPASAGSFPGTAI